MIPKDSGIESERTLKIFPDLRRTASQYRHDRTPNETANNPAFGGRHDMKIFKRSTKDTYGYL